MVLEKEMLHVERLHSQLDLSKPIIKNLIIDIVYFLLEKAELSKGKFEGNLERIFILSDFNEFLLKVCFQIFP